MDRGDIKQPATSPLQAGTGTPQDFMWLIDQSSSEWHRRDSGLGTVALSQQTNSRLGYFDGTHLYEHADPQDSGFIPTGTALSSITAGMKSVAFC